MFRTIITVFFVVLVVGCSKAHLDTKERMHDSLIKTIMEGKGICLSNSGLELSGVHIEDTLFEVVRKKGVPNEIKKDDWRYFYYSFVYEDIVVDFWSHEDIPVTELVGKHDLGSFDIETDSSDTKTPIGVHLGMKYKEVIKILGKEIEKYTAEDGRPGYSIQIPSCDMNYGVIYRFDTEHKLSSISIGYDLP